MILFQPRTLCAALAKQVGLDLIDGRRNLIELDQINETIRVKIGNADFYDRVSNCFLVPVRFGGIDHAIAGADSRQNAFLTFRAVHHKGAEAEDGHLDSVVQSKRVHHDTAEAFEFLRLSNAALCAKLIVATSSNSKSIPF